MNRILIISAVFPPEPVVSAKIAYDLCSALSSNKNVTVLCPKPTRPYGFNFSNFKITDKKINRIEVKSYTCPQSSFFGRLRENISFGLVTSNYIHKHHSELNAVYADTWPLIGQYFIVRAASQHNLPIAIHVQDIYPEAFSNKLSNISGILNFILLPLDKYILKKATSIIAISDYMKDYLANTRKISKSKISVVLNWHDDSTFLEFNSTSDQVEKFTFMYLGNIGPVASINLLIDAFALANIPKSRLIIAGSGSMKEELSKQAALNKDLDIQFWTVPDGKVPETQSKADVMLLAIKKGAALSSIPSKLPAYMFSSKPIICCADAHSDTAKCIRDANCGYLVEPDNIEELSKVLIAIRQLERITLINMGARGRNYALDVFSKEVNLNKLTTVVNNLLTNEYVVS